MCLDFKSRIRLDTSSHYILSSGKLTLRLTRKELTDYKIKAMFELFISNAHCKHVVLGCSHDHGYIPMLDQYKNNARARDRITLLHTENPAQGYHGLPFPTTKFMKLLKSSSTLNGPFKSTNTSPLKSSRHGTTPPKSPVDLHSDLTQASTGLISPRSPKDETKHQGRQRKYLYPRPIIVNKKQQRLDQELPIVDPEAALALDVRLKNSSVRPCNEFNLTGKCTRQGCTYDHQHPLPSAQCLPYAKKTREGRCKMGWWCRNEMCIYGHMCQGDAKGYCHWGEGCNLKLFHGMDTTVNQEIPLTESGLPVRA